MEGVHVAVRCDAATTAGASGPEGGGVAALPGRLAALATHAVGTVTRDAVGSSAPTGVARGSRARATAEGIQRPVGNSICQRQTFFWITRFFEKLCISSCKNDVAHNYWGIVEFFYRQMTRCSSYTVLALDKRRTLHVTDPSKL